MEAHNDDDDDDDDDILWRFHGCIYVMMPSGVYYRYYRRFNAATVLSAARYILWHSNTVTIYGYVKISER